MSKQHHESMWGEHATPRRPGNRRHLADDGDAFLPDSRSAPAHSRVELAEMLAEEFVTSVTSAERGEPSETTAPEEIMGPFTVIGGDPQSDEGGDGEETW